MLEATIQIVDACLEALDYLANSAYFIKFDLKLVNLAEYRSKAGDLSVGHLHCVACTVVLDLGRRLRLLGKLQHDQHPCSGKSLSRRAAGLRIAIVAVSSTSNDQSGRRAPVDWWDPGVIALDWMLSKRRGKSYCPVAMQQLQSVPGEIAALRS